MLFRLAQVNLETGNLLPLVFLILAGFGYDVQYISCILKVFAV